MSATTKEVKDLITSSERVTHSSVVALGEKLELTSNQRVKYNADVFRLTDAIQERISVARFYVSGSYGRRVTIGSTEIDLVVFLRNSDRLPPYAKSNDDYLPRLHSNLMQDFSNDKDVKIAPLTPDGCFLGDAKKRRSCKNPHDLSHQCCPEFVTVQIEDATFRIFLAPALGKTSEEQRQATYRRMQEVLMRGGELTGWNPSLIERPSEAMVQAKPEVKAFIRVCQYWVQSNSIHSISKYAVETLAFLVAKQMITENDDEWVVEGLRQFLSYCTDLGSVRNLCEIEPPAAYISPFEKCPSDSPILTDNFNPYNNLLEFLTLSDREQLAFAARQTHNLLSDEKRTTTFGKLFEPHISKATKSSTSLRLIMLPIVVMIAMYAGHLFNKYHLDFDAARSNFIADVRYDAEWLLEWVLEALQILWGSLQQWFKVIHEDIEHRIKALNWY